MASVEERTIECEKKMETQVDKMTNNATGEIPISSSTDELKEFKMTMLENLREVRDRLKAESGSIDEVRKERDQALKENNELRKRIDKLEYRVSHLTKNLSEAKQL